MLENKKDRSKDLPSNLQNQLHISMIKMENFNRKATR